MGGVLCGGCGIVTTFGSLYTGFGGVDVGAQQAGLTPVWGLELRADVAAVANHNLGGHVRVGNILDADPADFAYVDVMHASPPCPNFSDAHPGGAETEEDIALARATARFVTTLQPRIFTLENVTAYKDSLSRSIIQDALFGAGYWLTIDHVNSANYGVPQTRKRMIVRAVRGGWVPHLPQPVPWVGWYEAIEDLLPGLPDSQFAPWQLERLPAQLTTCIVQQGGYDGQIVTVDATEPVGTITANHNQLNLRAFLMGGSNTSSAQAAPGVGVSMEDEPSHYLTTNNVLGWRAWLVDSQNARSDTGPPTCRADGEPAFTVTATAMHKGIAKSLLRNGRVVSMTPRALARFQSFPDWYELPCNKTLAAYGIGNAVPPLLYRRIAEGLVQP